MPDVSRRSFLAAGAAALSAPAISGPTLLGMQDKSGTRPPIMGSGEHQYEATHDWGQLPPHIKYGNTHSIVEDSHGHIYVHHTVHPTSDSGDAVVVFDEKGKFVRSFGSMFRNGAHGMYLHKEGREEYLYFCDERHGLVTKRTLKGQEVWTMGYPQEAAPYEKGPGKPGLNYRPTNIAIAANGDFWVADGYGSYFAFHYDKNLKLKNVFGGRPPAPAPTPGAAPAVAAAPPAPGTPRPPAPLDQLNNPHGIWMDSRDAANPVLLIADRGNRRILRYTLDDKPIDAIEGLQLPCHFHQRGNLLVVPDLQCRVTLLDENNNVLVHLGDGAYAGKQNQLRVTTDRSQFESGKFIVPHGAWFDHAGNIFVAEWVEIGRITKLRKV